MFLLERVKAPDTSQLSLSCTRRSILCVSYDRTFDPRAPSQGERERENRFLLPTPSVRRLFFFDTEFFVRSQLPANFLKEAGSFAAAAIAAASASAAAPTPKTDKGADARHSTHTHAPELEHTR